MNSCNSLQHLPQRQSCKLLHIVMALLLLVTLVSTTGCWSSKTKIQRVSSTPAPEEAKGTMYVATETPVKVQAENVFPIAKKDLLGVATSDTEFQYKRLGTDEIVKGNLKGKLVVDSVALYIKGYTENIATNKPITVGIEGTDVIAEKNVSGYYLIHKDDLKALMRDKRSTSGTNP